MADVDMDSTVETKGQTETDQTEDQSMEHGDQEEEEEEQPQQSRKRGHSSDEDMDGDGGSEGDRPRKKKHRSEHPGAKFIDDIAVNEDDEDEPDEEEEDEEEEDDDNGDGEPDDGEDLTDERGIRRDAAEGAEDRRKGKKHGHGHKIKFRPEEEDMHRRMDQDREMEETRALAAKFESRYKDDGVFDMDFDEDGANRSSSGAVLPSVRDPSLFILRVGKGEREDDVVFQLMQQFYKRELDPDPSRQLHITSVFTTPASKGYIYVEAFREVHVEQAIKALPKQRMVSYFANSKKNIKVPITEMVQAIKFRSEQNTVQLKQWVRFKRGPNKDDLAQVVNVQDQGTIITLKFVPRLDYLYLEAKRKNEKLTRQQYKLQTQQSGQGLKRPAQKYFEEREVRQLGFPVEKKRGTGMDKHTQFYHFMNQKFKNGFQYKDQKIDALETEHVNPSVAELERFTQRAADSDEDEDEDERKAQEDAVAAATAASYSGSRRPVVYSTGDRVQITAGALRNVTGRVISISKDRLTIQSDLPSIPIPIEEVLSHVKKYFSVGAHVKVVSGVYKNETGMICHVPEDGSGDDKLAIHTDISARTIEVASQDVIESSEVSIGRDTFGNYELHELVQLTNDVVGVIIRVHMASFYVLTNTGSVQQVKLQEIQNKRNDKFSHTPDKNGDAVNREDKVVILTGPERGKKALVMHIFKRTLFVHSREVLDNGGLFVVRGDQVALVGGRAANRQAPRSPGGGARSPGPVPQSPGRSTGGPAQARGGGGRFQRDPIIGKDVKITGGPYKGYAGVCLDVVEGGQARVEIRAIFRKVSVARNQIMEVEVVASRVSANPFYGSQTPLVGGATPAHPGFGGATPAYELGGMTPAHAGSRTPSHDVWSAKTPRHQQEDRQPDEEDEQEEWRMSMGLDTAPTPSNPHTPGAVPQTPRTPAIPPTPQSDPYAVPQTPATPYETPMPDEEEGDEDDHPPVEGTWTNSKLIGCHVQIRGGPATGTITDIQAGGASVKVKPSTGGRAQTFMQGDLTPVQPTNGSSAIFLQSQTGYDQYQRCKVLSTLMTDAVLDDGGMVSLSSLCECEPEDEEEEEHEETAASSSSKKATKKSKSKSKK